MIRLVDVKFSARLPQRLCEIYFESFPVEERRDWADLLSRIDDVDSPLNISVIEMGDGVAVGFITWWSFEEFVYVEHFAVDASMRGGGVGSDAIRKFVEQIDKPVVLEVEPAGSNDMADRRIGFYERCGFVAHPDFEYIQPPYAPHLPEVPLMLMSTAEVALPSVAASLHRYVYGV